MKRKPRQRRPHHDARGGSDPGPALEDLLTSPLLLGRTCARAERGDHTARQALADYDAAWEAFAETGGDVG